MKDQTKTPFRAEAWAKNPMLTSSLLSVPEGNKRRLSEEDHDRNKKATSIPHGKSLLTSKMPTHLVVSKQWIQQFDSKQASFKFCNPNEQSKVDSIAVSLFTNSETAATTL